MRGTRGLKRVLNRRDDDLANVDPLEFERIIAAWYERQGYRVEHAGSMQAAQRISGDPQRRSRTELPSMPQRVGE